MDWNWTYFVSSTDLSQTDLLEFRQVGKLNNEAQKPCSQGPYLYNLAKSDVLDFDGSGEKVIEKFDVRTGTFKKNRIKIIYYMLICLSKYDFNVFKVSQKRFSSLTFQYQFKIFQYFGLSAKAKYSASCKKNIKMHIFFCKNINNHEIL